MKVVDLLAQAAHNLRLVNQGRSLLEARLLLAHSLRCRIEDLFVRDQEEVSEDKRKYFEDLVQRRLRYEPIAYLVGKKEFYDLEFDVNPFVLIPRPETEQLVQGVVDWIRGRRMSQGRIIDLGTGSGCVAISLAKVLGENFEVVAWDISSEALEVAKKNANKHGVKIHFEIGDIRRPFGNDWTIIVSNPPYIDPSEWEALSPDIRDYEPRLALLANDGGRDFLVQIVKNWGELLASPGLLALETAGPQQRFEVSQLFTQSWQIGPHHFFTK